MPGRDRQADWRNEYVVLRGIRLEIGDSIPHAVMRWLKIVSGQGAETALPVLDVGCGEGRIGIHLARADCRVIGFDFVPEVLGRFRAQAEREGLAGLIDLHCADIAGFWPVMDGAVRAVFAVTVIENLVTVDAQRHFVSELVRVLAPEGLAVIEWYGPDDGYYGVLDSPNGSCGGDRLVVDPHNGLTFRLFTYAEVCELVGDGFDVVDVAEFHFTSNKYGGIHERTSHLVVLRKKPLPMDGKGLRLSVAGDILKP